VVAKKVALCDQKSPDKVWACLAGEQDAENDTFGVVSRYALADPDSTRCCPQNEN